MKNYNKYESTNHSVCLRNLSTLFQGVKDRVLCELIYKKGVRWMGKKELIDCYLFVELVNIVGSLVLGLHVNWVLLYSLSCGHIGKRWWLVIERSGLKKRLNALMTRVCFVRSIRQQASTIQTYIMDNYQQLKVFFILFYFIIV